MRRASLGRAGFGAFRRGGGVAIGRPRAYFLKADEFREWGGQRIRRWHGVARVSIWCP